MPLFITVSEGPRADQARPVLATGDQRLVSALLETIGRLGDSQAPAEDDERGATPVTSIGRKRRQLPVAVR